MLTPVTFHYTLGLRCDAEPDTAVLLAVLPACTHHQQLAMERLSVHGAATQSVFTEAATATRYLYLVARGGPLEIDLDARVRLLQAEPGIGHGRHEAHALERLGTPEALRCLLPSRWCASDELGDLAAREFLPIDAPVERLQAIDRWVRRRVLALPPPDARAYTPRRAPQGVHETLERGVGTARDLAHLCIALCRASRLPARFVTTVPIDGATAHDLHPWIEVLVDEAWLALDPTRRVPRPALMRLGTGRDAADVPLFMAHGDVARLEVDAALVPEGTTLASLRVHDARTESICAATLGSLDEATRWNQEARLATRRPDAHHDAARPTPSRIVASAARAASTTPRDSGPVPVFSTDVPSRLPGVGSPPRIEPF